MFNSVDIAVLVFLVYVSGIPNTCICFVIIVIGDLYIFLYCLEQYVTVQHKESY